MMNILSIDCSGAHSGVALLSHGVVTEMTSQASRSHASSLLQLLEALLRKAGLPLKDVDCFAYACGPGGYTGLRVAAALIEGLHLVHECPIVNISSLQALAYAAFRQEQIASVSVVRHAYGDNVYTGGYKRDDKIAEANVQAQMMTVKAFSQLLTLKKTNNSTDHLLLPKSAAQSSPQKKCAVLSADMELIQSHCSPSNGWDLLEITQKHLAEEVGYMAEPYVKEGAQTQGEASCRPYYLKNASDWLKK